MAAHEAPAAAQRPEILKDVPFRASLSTGVRRRIGAVGPRFIEHAMPHAHAQRQKSRESSALEDANLSEDEEQEDAMMLQRDAKQWKQQDHYAVLGLSKYRYKATDEQIKRAHRKKVLKHHPDKRAAAGGVEDDSFFKCIQKANEILLDPVKRRQFDSVDENADKDPPTKKQLQKGNFYKLWGPVFESEARFSRQQPMPQLGDEESTKEEVEEFYNSWYHVDSWRTFEYLDEDVPDDNENRDQKRHVERKNNNARRKKKTEDTTRLRKLVDDCLAGDERIKKFRQAERSNKNKKRNEREAAEKQAKEDAERAKAEEAQRQKDKEEADKADRAEGKKAKEAAKNAAKKNKRVLRGSVKDFPAAFLEDVDRTITRLDNQELADVAGQLNGKEDKGEIETLWKELMATKLS